MPYSSNSTINGLDAETSIADTDELIFGDVSDTNRAKKITFANLKTEIVGDDTAFVRKADYDANSILYATSDNTPVALTVGTNSVVGRVAGNITTLAVDSDLSSVSASDDTVPSAKATKTALDLKANDSAVVKLTGDQTVAGVKTFSSDPLIPDEAYGVGWNGVLEPPTKNAVYDKIETMASGILVLLTASDNLKYSADTERTQSSTITYTKHKEIVIRQKGTVRVVFDLKGSDTTYAFYGRIYVNGVASGTERLKQGAGATSYTTYSEDITINAYDLVQLYIKNEATGGLTTYCRNFRIYYDITNPDNGTVNTD